MSLPVPVNKSNDTPVEFETLTPQQRAFAYKYLETFDPRRAGKDVGISADMAIRTINNPIVGRYINHLFNAQEPQMVLSRAFLQTKLFELLPKLEGEEPVALIDRDGASFKGKKFHSGDYLRALELIAKHTNFIAPTVSGGGIHISIDLNRLGMSPDSPQPRAAITIDGDLAPSDG